MLQSGNRDINMISDRCGQGRVWKSLKINDKDHMICFTEENESWKILLTNLIEIWTETLTGETMFHKCQVLESQVLYKIFPQYFFIYYICYCFTYIDDFNIKKIPDNWEFDVTYKHITRKIILHSWI